MKKRLIVILSAVLILSAACGVLAEGWTCPSCGRQNSDKANFCGGCRTARPSVNHAGGADTNAWVCSRCGKVGPDTDSFCINCGADHTEGDQRALLIPEEEPAAAELPRAGSVRYGMRFSAEDETDSFALKPETNGIYSFRLEECVNGYCVHLTVTAADGGRVDALYMTYPRDFLSVELRAGEKYTVTVEQCRETGPFTLVMGVPRPEEDITGYGKIRDGIDYAGQRNIYRIKPALDGLYRFELAECMYGDAFHVQIFDTHKTPIDGSYGGSGTGVTAELKAGEIYMVQVEYYANLDPYTLIIGCQRPTADITGCGAVGDSIRFTDQRNRYALTAPKDGEVSIELKYAEAGFAVRVEVFDGYGNRQGAGYLTTGNSCTAELTGGQVYTVYVSYYNGPGEYDLAFAW